ncbi:MAG: metallophosphoesterase [Methanomassiliicoccus sp.]|nr:metallophosphoesterase [Methanomassiliicoccus sp.]
MADITPIPDHPALEIRGSQKVICVGDLHVGLESEMRARGVHVPSQTHRMERELTELSQGRDRVVLLGDVKNKVPGSTAQEHAELPRFFRSLQRNYSEVDVVRGNHDTNIEDFLPTGVNVHPSTGFRIDDVGFAHGHTWPSPEVMSASTLVIGHNHPTIALEDSLGNISKEPCWVRLKVREGTLKRYVEVPNEIIMVPAFNRNLGGSPVNLSRGKLLGPLFSEGFVDVSEGRVYLTDGIYLGTIGSLMVQSTSRVRTLPHRSRPDY